jgi:hypothetical protein
VEMKFKTYDSINLFKEGCEEKEDGVFITV